MSMKLLVVDDSSIALKLVSRALEQAGYEVVQAGSGDEALKIIDASEPFDLITLDLVMEGMDGYEVCRTIRQLDHEDKSQTPIIFITSKDTIDVRTKGFEMGAADFISKEDLAMAIGPAVDKILKPDAILENNVLVLDKNPIESKMICNSLKTLFRHVQHEEDGELAYAMIKQNPDHFDMIVTTTNLEVAGGIELTRRIRNDLGLKTCPIVLLAAPSEKGKIIEFFKMGGTDSIQTPYLVEELKARVKAHIDKAALDAALNETVEKLKELNREKDDYLAACSHDLKSPLNAIMGFTSLVLEDLEETETAPQCQDDLRKVLEASNVLHELISDITELYRIQTENADVHFNDIDIIKVIVNCVTLCRPLADRKGVDIAFVGDDNEEIFIRANALGIQRVINNFLSNALKFTEKGGKISVLIERVVDGDIKVAIQDTGMGMDDKTREHLFQKFSKSSKSGTSGEKGVGLGLMITKQIIEQHGGSIQVESELGKGSTFYFLLPQSKKTAAA